MNEENNPQRDDSDMTRHGVSVSDVIASQYGLYTSTPDQAANALSQAGFPVDPRSVKRNCKSGILDCDKFNSKTGEKWMVNPESVMRRITQLQQYQKDDSKADVSGHTMASHDVSGHVTPKDDGDKEVQQVGNTATSEIIDILKEQLSRKDEQIGRKDKHIDAMLVRDQETNILIKNLQEMLSSKQLGAGRESRREEDEKPVETEVREIHTDGGVGDNSHVDESAQ